MAQAPVAAQNAKQGVALAEAADVHGVALAAVAEVVAPALAAHETAAALLGNEVLRRAWLRWNFSVSSLRFDGDMFWLRRGVFVSRAGEFPSFGVRQKLLGSARIFPSSALAFLSFVGSVSGIVGDFPSPRTPNF